jgi:purine-binding chemotaxis protein CheW
VSEGEGKRQMHDRAGWAEAIRRLARGAETASFDEAPSPLHVEEIFAERARALAAPREGERSEAYLDLIAFELGGQKVAIESRYIFAVIAAAEPTPVPGGPEILAGIVNFRGRILPVFRLERALGAGMATPGCTLIVGEHRPEFAFFAHAVEEISSLSQDELHKAPWQNTGDVSVALGVSAAALNVLDGRALLSDPRFFAGRVAARMEEGMPACST